MVWCLEMAKNDFFRTEGILVDDMRYLPYKVSTEAELEDLVLANSDALFPNAYIFETKFSATDPLGNKTHADMCLVSSDCKSWWIIETERSQNDYYTRNSIAPQIALQKEADWMPKIDQVISEICKLGANKEEANNLRNIEPNFILLTDDHNKLIREVAKYYNFKQIIVFPMKTITSRFCLLPLLQEVNPPAPQSSILRLESSEIDLVSNMLWIPVDNKLVKNCKIKHEVSILIDGEYKSSQVHATGKISIGISKDSKSQTSRLAYNLLPFVFEIDDGGQILLLKFREEEKIW
jgi:hypothetical protein